MKLATGHFYKNRKTLEDKIHMYNPKPQYAQQLKQLMRQIDDSSRTTAVSLNRPAASPSHQISSRCISESCDN